MRVTLTICSLIAFLLGTRTAEAQLSLAVQMDPTPSPYISDWRSNPNTIRFIVTNSTGAPVDVRFDAYIEGDARGRVAQTKAGAAIPPVTIPPGTTTLNGIDAGLLDENAVEYIGPSRAQTQRTGRLPEDNFRLCVRLLTYLEPFTPLTPEACARFEIRLIQPPNLIAPANASNVQAAPAFQWSVVPLGRGTFARYELTVVELDPGQTNVTNAMQTNIPLLVRESTLPVYQMLASDPTLEKGKRYAWRVRAYDLQDRYTFANGGYSEIWSFTWNPVIPAGLDTAKIVLKTTTKSPYTPITMPIGKNDLKIKILTNARIEGQYMYTFSRGKLYNERVVGKSILETGTIHLNIGRGSELKPLANVVVRLVRRYKTIPELMYMAGTVYDVTNQKSYNTGEKIVAESKTDASGNFSFSFIESEPTVIVSGVAMRCGGGEFADYKENVTLYKYYHVEVVNAHYCSSGHEITVEPGASATVSLSSLVRSYNLKITIKDSEKNVELGDRVDVFVARASKNMRPTDVPEDEGELEEGGISIKALGTVSGNTSGGTSGGTTQMPDDPEYKFSSSKYGYVIGATHTRDNPAKGVVTFRKLVRNVGGWDGYYVSANTPEKTPSGSYNFLYYHPNNKAWWASFPTRPQDEGFGGAYSNYSASVVYNKYYEIPTFEKTIKLVPRMPRIIGQVIRSDSRKPVENVVVRLTTNPENPQGLQPDQYDGWFYDVTNSNGRYEVTNIQPSGSMWSYDVSFLKVGYDKLVKTQVAIAKGNQIVFDVDITPKLVITRSVVDEQDKPLPGVEGVLGDGLAIKTNEKGVFVSRAVPGWQPFHLEKRVEYADKDTNVTIQDNAFEVLGALLVDKIVMFKALRRVAVRVYNEQGQPVKDAQVILTDFYSGPVTSPGSGGAGGGGGFTSSGGMKLSNKMALQLASPYLKHTDANGWVQFAYKSPLDYVKVSITVPNSDYVSKDVTLPNIKENGTWTKWGVTLKAGGRVAGVVYAGERRDKPSKLKLQQQGTIKPQQQTPPPGGQGGIQSGVQQGLQQAGQSIASQIAALGVPVKGARVFIEGREDYPVYTDENGRYELRAVPPGARTVKAARTADSVGAQLVGDEQTVTVVALQTSTANLYLTKYNGMDITRLLGFPLEIDKLTELAGGRIRIDGAFVDVPANGVFKVRDDEDRHAFANIELAPDGTGTPAPAKPIAGNVQLLDTKVLLTAYGAYNTELVAAGGVLVVPDGANMSRGRFRAPVRLPMTGWAINSNELTLEDADGNPMDFYVRRVRAGGSPLTPLVAALTSEGSFDDGGAPLRVAGANGGDVSFTLYAYDALAKADSSWLASDGMHLVPTVRVTLEGCGATMSSTCSIDFPLGKLHVKKSGMDPLDPSTIAEQTIALQKWNLRANAFSIQNGYLTFNGEIRAPLVANKTDEASRIGVPFTGMQLRPDALTGGTFPTNPINVLDITKVEITDPFVLAADQDTWYLSSLDPEIRINQGGGKVLEGFDPAEKFTLTEFKLRSNATHAFSMSEKTYVVYQVSTFKIASMKVDWDGGKAALSMLGSLTLTGIPDLAPQATRFYFTAGGKFGMDGVFLNDGYNAGGVKLYIANGLLGPDGFTAVGDWGQYKNRIALQGKFSLNTVFRHRKVGGGFSTVAEVINASYNPPQNQSLFGNTSQPDVKNVYGRTQLEPGNVWSTNIVGWYATPELAGKDSVRFEVQGSGGNGTVVTASGTLKMKGTRGGLSSLYIARPDEYPKGPIAVDGSDGWDATMMGPAPPSPADDGPFSGMTITTDFENMALIATVQVDYEVTPGTQFKGFIETVLSFGPKKFWSFFAAGSGTIDNPHCEGKAVFIAGLNYEVPAERQQMLIDYSISKRPLPDEFKTMSGFFTQVAVVMPIPGTPNFSIDVVMFSLSVECSMGGEARLGLNFANGTTFYIGIYAMAKVEIKAGATIWFPPIPVAVSVKGHVLVAAGAGGYYTYNSNAGSSFDITGFILGKLDVEGCVWVLGAEACTGTFTVFEIGGEVNGRIGNNEYLDITPTFKFLSF